jgi:hypothetical protein
VVEGSQCLSFCPRDPHHILPFSSVEDILANSQREFWALELGARAGQGAEEAMRESRYPLSVAESDGTLAGLASTYVPENHAIYDGLSRQGVRLVTFAPVLKHGVFPLADVLALLLEIGARGMNRPVEIEFAVRRSGHHSLPDEFAVLQMRPLVLSREGEDLDAAEPDAERLVIRSASVMGNGRAEVMDLVVVDADRFDRAQSVDAAAEVARLNAELLAEGRPYLLVGVGRWGSHDPWLGVPVTWDQISGAKVIVEAGFRDFRVTPSQGSHFFQNLSSFEVGYFTVNEEAGEGFVSWRWIAERPARTELRFTRHLRFDEPLVIRMNGRRQEGVVYKPGRARH